MYTVNFVDEHDALVWGRPPLCVCIVELDRALLQTRCVTNTSIHNTHSVYYVLSL